MSVGLADDLVAHLRKIPGVSLLHRVTNSQMEMMEMVSCSVKDQITARKVATLLVQKMNEENPPKAVQMARLLLAAAETEERDDPSVWTVRNFVAALQNIN